ncbi:MAG: F0F1 ATP synthase subunit A [Maricaulaceae bacterium]|jgi:F-type H+-transporting ATPase subunit a
MQLTTDEWVFWRYGAFELNATIVFTWVVMAVLTLASMLVTRRLSTDETPPPWQNLLEVIVGGMRDQVREVAQRETREILPFVGTLFLFIATANLLAVVPGYRPPTASLSTATALALAVFVAVPIFGVAGRGLGGYLANYVRPTPLMLPFNVIGELSRTFALAVRLYGNVMSGVVIVGILISIAPFLFPVVLQLLGLLTGLVQAYIFAVLATVYIASASRAHAWENPQPPPSSGEPSS